MAHSCTLSELAQPPWVPSPANKAWKGLSVMERKQSRSVSCGSRGGWVKKGPQAKDVPIQTQSCVSPGPIPIANSNPFPSK